MKIIYLVVNVSVEFTKLTISSHSWRFVDKVDKVDEVDENDEIYEIDIFSWYFLKVYVFMNK